MWGDHITTKYIFTESIGLLFRYPILLILSAIPLLFNFLGTLILKLLSEKFTNEKYYISFEFFLVISSIILSYIFLGIIAALSMDIQKKQLSFRNVPRFFGIALLGLLKLLVIFFGISIIMMLIFIIGGRSLVIWIFLLAMIPIGMLFSILLIFAFPILVTENVGWKIAISESYLLIKNHLHDVIEFLVCLVFFGMIWNVGIFVSSLIPLIGSLIRFCILICLIAFYGVVLGFFISEAKKNNLDWM